MKENKFISYIVVITIVISLGILNPSYPVQADAAPPPGAVGSTLFPNLNQTNVRMEAETVLMTIPENSDYWSGHAIVTATFYMRNMGDETEDMKVRFPMNMAEYDLRYEVANGEDYCQPISSFPSLQDLSVKIDGEDTNISTKTTTYDNQYSAEGESTSSTINCWAYFDVSFPPEEQVIIEVQYKVYGYKVEDRFVQYNYILQTGERWYGTIGSTDIVVNLPYNLDDTIIRSCSPNDCTISENTVWWHYEDFEPQDNIEIKMIDPSIWSRVVRETINTQYNSEDGNAWGRLGMAYKEILTDSHGIISANEFPEIFEKAVKAYQNAVYVRPYDSDWHLGYSDLICPYAVDAYYAGQEDAAKYAHLCGLEIDTLLYQKPADPNVMQYLKFLYTTYPEFFIDNGFNIFTTKMKMPTLAAIPTKSAETEVPTAINTRQVTSTATQLQTATLVPSLDLSFETTFTATINPFDNVVPQLPFDDGSKQKNQVLFSIFGNIILLLLVFLFAYFRRRK